MSESRMSPKMEKLVILAIGCLLAAWFGYYRFEDPLAPKFQDSSRITLVEIVAVTSPQN